MRNIALLFISLIAFSTCRNRESNLKFDGEKYKFSPIGVFHTPYTPESGAPIQGRFEPDRQARIEVYEPYETCLEGLAEFKYIIVTYVFDRTTNWNPTLLLPDGRKEKGVFATRTPLRPNPIGISIVKVDKVVGNSIYVTGIDAYDQTPILDIKPYIYSIDCMTDANTADQEREMGFDEKFIIKLPDVVVSQDSIN